MRVKINPGRASGTVRAPYSKSMAHRMLIAAARAEGKSVIRGVSESADVRATVDCLRAMGVRIDIDKAEDRYTVFGIDFTKAKPSGALNCNESGSTLRFMIPLATLCGKRIQFSGAKRLFERPLTLYQELYGARGYDFELSEGGLCASGALEGGEYTIRGDVSSQFITGLIFALSGRGEGSIIHILPPFESRSYIDLTLRAVSLFGIDAHFAEDNFTVIINPSHYKPASVTVEGDYSGAVFIDALAAFGMPVAVTGLDPDSLQGDRVYKPYIDALKRGYARIDLGNCPDLAPMLFALAGALHGACFTGTARLKIKESDRAEAMKTELAKLGIKIDVAQNHVEIHAEKIHAPSAMIASHNDHRIVMSLAVLLCLVGGEIEGAEAINKSYPEFFQDLRSLGIEVTEYDT